MAILTLSPSLGLDMSQGIFPRGDMIGIHRQGSSEHSFAYVDEYGDYAVERFYGYGFGYDWNGNLAFGRLTDQERFVEGQLALTLEDIDVSVALLIAYVDAHDVEGELAYVFRSDDLMIGSDYDDVLIGMGGHDDVYGYAGHDDLYGEDGDDYLRGGDGDDYLVGGAGFDDLHGNAGADTLYGGWGDDWVVGGKDDDDLYGDAGFDIVLGNLGDDLVLGGDGDDWVRGGQGDDVVLGGDGWDFLSGDRGNDTLTGGAGADDFHFFGSAGLDVVTDFNAAEGDRVLLLAGSSWTAAQVGSDTVITVDGAGQMVLQGVDLASLSSGWIVG